VKVIPHPIALPGKCSLCGASDNDDGRKYVDIGFELDFYGVIYFCTHCFIQIADSIGYIAPEVNEVIYNDMARHANRVSELEAENVKLRVSLSSLDFLGSHGTVNDFDSGIEESVVEEGRDNSKPSKSTDEPGHTNVPKAGKSKSAKSGQAEFDDLQ
jgi:hypothetical protein